MSVTFGREKNCIENTHTLTLSLSRGKWKRDRQDTGRTDAGGGRRQAGWARTDRQTDRRRPGSTLISSPVRGGVVGSFVGEGGQGTPQHTLGQVCDREYSKGLEC